MTILLSDYDKDIQLYDEARNDWQHDSEQPHGLYKMRWLLQWSAMSLALTKQSWAHARSVYYLAAIRCTLKRQSE
jgi:hypothetical protein